MNLLFLAVDIAKVHGILARFEAYPWAFVAMPFFAALIGYVTKLAAIKMMFDPIEYKGVGKIGWQGILPKRAGRMASIIVDTMTRDIVDAREFIDKIDPERALKEMEGPFLESVDRIARGVLDELRPGMWDSLPERARATIVHRIQTEAPAAMQRIMDDLKENLDEVFDLKHMVVSNLIRDKALLNKMFREVGKKEFRFIANFGLPAGFVIGLVQAVVYLLFPNPFILPAFGLFVGYSTDWLALRLLFRPLYPKKILGVTFQGLFIKRQQEVTKDYARIVSEEVLTPKNIFDALLKGPCSDSLVLMIQENVREVVDEQAGRARPLVRLAVGTRQYEDLKAAIAERLIEELPATLDQAAAYTEKEVNLRQLITDKISEMNAEQFESLLRPAFQADEWILVTVGAALGFLVGLTQDTILVPLFASIGPGPKHAALGALVHALTSIR